MNAKIPLPSLVGAFLVLSVGGCKCGPKTATLSPQLLVLQEMSDDPRTSVDFGLVQVGLKGTQNVRIRNGGTATLTINSFTTTQALFGVDTTLPADIDPSQELELVTTFTPMTADLRVTGTLTLSTNDSDALTYDLMMGGQGVTAVATATPNPLALGDVYVGESASMKLTVTNAGGDDLPITLAKVTGSPDGVSADFSALTGQTIPAGMSVSVMVTYAPTMPGDITGTVEIDIDAMHGGNLVVPLTGHGTQALPTMCFKYDDTGMETCTTQTSTSLNIDFGLLCDNRVYATGPNACTAMTGQRSGQLTFKNTGNTPVKYSVLYKPYPYGSPRCSPDAGAPQSDFVFSNIAVPDGGLPMDFTMQTSSLPNLVTDPMPWQTAPIEITYRASSLCPSDSSDQALISWQRQDAVTTRMPSTLFMTLTGGSRLPSAKPKPVNIGQPNQAASVPFGSPLPVQLVTNEGSAPMTLDQVSLWEELQCLLPDGGTYDGGGPTGGCLSLCDMSNEASACSKFNWAPDGGDPATLLPISLDAGPGAQATVGSLFVGCLADGGSCPTAVTKLLVYAIVSTSDPYASQVIVPLTAYVQATP